MNGEQIRRILALCIGFVTDVEEFEGLGLHQEAIEICNFVEMLIGRIEVFSLVGGDQ